jgi:hypothetical protein
VPSPELRERFDHADVQAPLSQHQRAELDAVLANSQAFEDLPGKWQAALLAAETAGAPSTRTCCGG